VKENVLRRRFNAGEKHSINRNAVYFSFLSLLLFSASFCPGASNNGCPTVQLNDWKFYFAGKDSSLSYVYYDSTRRYQDAAVPHMFPCAGKNNEPRQGFGWYYRVLDVPASSSDKDVFLCFEGVALRSKVFVNGVFAGASDYAYLPFKINLTPFFRAGTALHLAVMVDNRLLDGSLPDTRARGWWNYGGLIREVSLRFVSRLRIDGVRVLTFYHAQDTFDLSLRLSPPQERWDSVSLVFSAADTPSCVFNASLRGTDTVLRIGGVRAWTPESPVLYRFAFVPHFKGRPGDTMRLQRGFCQLTARGSRLFLNGNPCFLRGMSRHDVLGGRGPLLTREERRSDLCDMKAMGVNFLRIAHFPQHRDVYELCDSLGLLVMDEIPAWKSRAAFLGSKRGSAYGAGYVRAMVEAHGNYACVCLWSVGNQLASYKTALADYVGAAAGEAKRVDPSRPVTYCSYYYLWDKAFSRVDVIAVNEYFGWELASLDMLGPMIDKIHKDWPDKPVLVSEFGAQTKPGLRNPAAKLAGAVKSMLTKDLSEDHHQLFLRSHMDSIWTRRAFVGGMVVWSYNDYMSYLNKARTDDMPVGLNACGVVTRDRGKKLSWEIVRQRYDFFRKQFVNR
jgi:beta-galactosidase/beta-glucuronidase